MSVSSFAARSRSRNPRKSSFSYMRCPPTLSCSILHDVVLHALPPADSLVFYIEQIEHPPDGVVDEIIDGLCPAVEGRNRRKYHAAHFRDGGHVADVRK